ncbi:protein kinase domain-containing protein [Kribbella jiaozuonensis]|uniref:protein kinase domain-containing protein n=1 Tax=Kribbella jiaozuonensis TaxID=2575441 RepID=UPI001F20F89C|nr:protein kinase [Kribbella jiaozuonensis]
MRRAGELIADRYRTEAVIGRGGMGEVYRAHDLLLGREVAVKVMLPVPGTLAASERFLREARAIAQLSDPHVVAAYDFGEYEDRFYLAMELVDGHTVGEVLRCSGPFCPDRAGSIIRQAAAGLAAAHREGIVHRDIKPDNLLLTGDGTVKVADFGIVRFLHDTPTTLTAAGQLVGTSHFLSPERALGKPAEPPSDIYALGCVFYQLVTGHPPFLGENPASVMFQHVQREPAPPSEIRRDLPGDVDELVLWMLAKDPSHRPTAAELADGAVPPSLTTPKLVTPPVRRKPAKPALIGAIAAVVLAAGVGTVLATRSPELPPTNNLAPSNNPTSTTPSVPTKPKSSPAPTAVRTTTIRPNPPAPPHTATPRAQVKPVQPNTHGKPPKTKQNTKKPKP